MTGNDRPLRLGFPVKVMGRPDLKSQDTRRWQKGPTSSVPSNCSTTSWTT